MKIAILVALAVVAPAAPTRYDDHNSREVVRILKDERHLEDGGTYSVDVETGNGIVLAQSGAPETGNGAVVKAGQYSYTAPDGTHVNLRFVADENGYQAQGDHLPVAPEFPHPIPDFVLDQIRKAAKERHRGGDYRYDS